MAKNIKNKRKLSSKIQFKYFEKSKLKSSSFRKKPFQLQKKSPSILSFQEDSSSILPMLTTLPLPSFQEESSSISSFPTFQDESCSTISFPSFQEESPSFLSQHSRKDHS